jgi:hypothetical protein
MGKKVDLAFKTSLKRNGAPVEVLIRLHINNGKYDKHPPMFAVFPW